MTDILGVRLGNIYWYAVTSSNILHPKGAVSKLQSKIEVMTEYVAFHLESTNGKFIVAVVYQHLVVRLPILFWKYDQLHHVSIGLLFGSTVNGYCHRNFAVFSPVMLPPQFHSLLSPKGAILNLQEEAEGSFCRLSQAAVVTRLRTWCQASVATK